MRFYFNHCYNGQSINEDNHNNTDQHNTDQMKNMPKRNNHNCNNNSFPDTKTLQKQHEIFELDNDYGAEEGLTIEYRGDLHGNDNKKKSRKVLIRCIVTALVILIIAGIITYVAIYGINKQRTSGDQSRDVNVLKSVKNNNVNTKYKNHGKNSVVSNKNNKNADVCITSACFKVADSIKQNMNFSVDPCDDFYEYTCGRWSEHHILKESEHKINVMGVLANEKNIFLKKIIEEGKLTKYFNKNSFKQKIVTFWKSCLSLQKIEKKGKLPLLNFISKFGNWSPIVQPNVIDTNVTDAIIMSHQYFTGSVYTDLQNSPLFRSGVKSNDRKPKEHLFEISPPDLPLPMPSMYIIQNDQLKSIRRKYRLLLTNYIALLGPSVNANKVLEDLMNFEVKLASEMYEVLLEICDVLQEKGTSQNIDVKNQLIIASPPYTNHTTIGEFARLVGDDQIDWLKIFQSYFTPINIKIDESTPIGVTSIPFFQSLNKLLKKTSKQLIKDYIIWICLWKFGSYVSAPFREADHNFQQALLGIQARPEPWMKCMQDLEQTMEFGLASLYVEKALTQDDKRAVTSLAENIQREFKRNLVNVEWMDVVTKAEAFEKVDLMIQTIGYPDFVRNQSAVDKLYEQVYINENGYFKNILNMYKNKRWANLKLLARPVDRTSYDLPPTLTDAYYDRNKNKMVLLAGLLHPPFYKPLRPKALNYGALGLVIGHEITHAFDNKGRGFDGTGQRRDWWSQKSSDAFKKKINCMKEQFSNYTMYGINLDGDFTLSENMGDSSGIKMAYLAYKQWERENGKEMVLPGLSMTSDQLLFISHGQILCGIFREEYMKNVALKSDRHSPAKFRVIGPLSNLPEFAEAFKCPVGSTMNPEKKCVIW